MPFIHSFGMQINNTGKRGAWRTGTAVRIFVSLLGTLPSKSMLCTWRRYPPGPAVYPPWIPHRRPIHYNVTILSVNTGALLSPEKNTIDRFHDANRHCDEDTLRRLCGYTVRPTRFHHLIRVAEVESFWNNYAIMQIKVQDLGPQMFRSLEPIMVPSPRSAGSAESRPSVASRHPKGKDDGPGRNHVILHRAQHSYINSFLLISNFLHLNRDGE